MTVKHIPRVLPGLHMLCVPPLPSECYSTSAAQLVHTSAQGRYAVCDDKPLFPTGQASDKDFQSSAEGNWDLHQLRLLNLIKKCNIERQAST